MFARVFLSFLLSILATRFEFGYAVTALHFNTTNNFMISNLTNLHFTENISREYTDNYEEKNANSEIICPHCAMIYSKPTMPKYYY